MNTTADEMVIQKDVIHVRILPGNRVSRRDASKLLGVSVGTMANWACKGIGPRAKRLANRAFYDVTELEKFRDGEG